MHQEDMNGSDPIETSTTEVPTQNEAVHQETPETPPTTEGNTEPTPPENGTTEPEETTETSSEVVPPAEEAPVNPPDVVSPPAAETPVAEEPAEESPKVEPIPETPVETAVEVAAATPVETTPTENSDGETGKAQAKEVPPEPVISPEDKLFYDLIQDEEAFEKHVDGASFQELSFLLEKCLQATDIGPLVRKVKIIKKGFDKIRRETPEEEQNVQTFGKFSLDLSRFNRRRQEYFAQLEEEKTSNSKKKQDLLDKLKELVEAERVQDINLIREIQNAWKDTGYILQKDIMPFNTLYKYYLDIFYNLRGKYHELLDTDRKYNLEQKLKVIGEMLGLLPDEEEQNRDSWREATEKIRGLQEFWKTVGAVPRDDLEANNAAYREALDKFFGARSTFFDGMDAERKENGDLKRKLLEELAPFESVTLNLAKEWNQATKKILAVQEKWKEIGAAGREENKILWKAYRNICNSFFKNKSEYFAKFDVIRNKNLEIKMAIIEQAEAIKDSENRKQTADTLKQLQRDWKNTGPVHDRHSNRIWKRFRAACDHFFSKRDARSAQDQEVQGKNLQAKLALITRLHELSNSDSFSEESLHTFRSIQEEWKAVGHVPFRQKDDVNNGFRKEMDNFFKKAEVNKDLAQKMKTEARMNLIVDDDMRARRIKQDTHKIRGRIQETERKINSYETNILYIAKGKKGDPLRNQIQASIDSEKEKVTSLKAKIKSLRELMEKPKEAPKQKPKAKAPAQPAAEEKPAEEPKAEAPAQPAAEEKPAEEPKAEAPAEPAEEEKPAEEPKAEAPAEPAEEEKPAE